MAHADDIAKTGQYSGGVLEGFAFDQCRTFKAGGLANFAAEQIKRRAETDSGSGAGFKKHIAENGAFKHPGDPFAQCIGFHSICYRENLLNILPLKLADGKYMRAGEVHAVPRGNLVGGF